MVGTLCGYACMCTVRMSDAHIQQESATVRAVRSHAFTRVVARGVIWLCILSGHINPYNVDYSCTNLDLRQLAPRCRQRAVKFVGFHPQSLKIEIKPDTRFQLVTWKSTCFLSLVCKRRGFADGPQEPVLTTTTVQSGSLRSLPV